MHCSGSLCSGMQDVVYWVAEMSGILVTLDVEVTIVVY